MLINKRTVGGKMFVNELKVLICDDSILIRKQISDILNSMGCQNISFAVDGKEAVTKYQEIMPDVVFMDIIMPELNGVDALKEIININPQAKVVIVSSAITQKYLKLSIEAGAFDFIHKPVFIEDVKKLVSKLLKEGE